MIKKQNELTIPEKIISKKISFLLNGEQKQVVIPPGMTLLEMIHDRLNLYGTKSTCNEGDCGACTVIIGFRNVQEYNAGSDLLKREEGKVVYQAVNSCIYPAARIQNKHLITVEGIGGPNDLHPIQKAMLDYHGTQCGYCTPGFVMALLALFLNNPQPEKDDILRGLEGNLCRCTGYDAILQAAEYLKKKLSSDRYLLPQKIRDAEGKIGQFADTFQDMTEENREFYSTIEYIKPATVSELNEILDSFESRDDYALINGGTDLLVQANVNGIYHPRLIDIAEIGELKFVREFEGRIEIGATSTLTEIDLSPLIRENLPLLNKAIKIIASSQIRNLATLTGNIGNASPVADTPPVLMVLDASLELTSSGNKRQIKLEEYFLDYKKTALNRGEFISKIIIPLKKGEFLYRNMQKAAKRRAVDISTVNSAISLEVRENICSDVRIAFGGVAVYTAPAKKTMSFLEGKILDPQWFAEAAEIAMHEFSPISDVRGQKEYRSVVIRNHLLQYLSECYDIYQDRQRRGGELNE